MVKFILKRIGTMIIAMFMIILITFTLMHSIPGGPFTNTKGVPEEVTQAMEAKCYHGGKGRSHWRRSRWQLRDTLVFAFFALVLAYMIYGRVCG